MKKSLLSLLILLGFQTLTAQSSFTRKDSLQGGLSIERTCFNVLRYDLDIKIDPSNKSIVGYNEITFQTVENTNTIQLDLFENMQIDSIIFDTKKLVYQREFNAVFIAFETTLFKKTNQKLRFYYSGKPTVAKNAPWDGGFVWKKDSNERDWVGVAVQGTGACLWYPVKDSQSDEPDFGASIKVAVPNGLMAVSNGRLMSHEDLKNGYTRWDWEVKNPINSYNITINIGDYVHFGEHYKGLDLDYYVLRENEAKAKIQFEEVKPMLDCFQSKFGEYPFKNDGYKLIETNYLGMEHQSAVSYGNKYKKGYLGTDLSDTGIGLLFDFILIHESGHEWFGNSITSKDIADMWIHEAFTCYSETVYIECQWGYEKAMRYVNGQASKVLNDIPIIGQYGVNKEGSGDMYYKGSLMLNTLRHVINDDAKWWKIILAYSNAYRYQIIDSKTVIAFFNTASGMNLTPIFNQYLKYTSLPTLEIKKKGTQMVYRWKTEEPNFEMPIDVVYKNKKRRLLASNQWKVSHFKVNSLEELTVLKDHFYIKFK